MMERIVDLFKNAIFDVPPLQKYFLVMQTVEGPNALFQYATEGILTTDSTGEITNINPSAERMFGYEPGELRGKKIEILIPQRFSSKHVGHRDKYHENPHPRSMGGGMNLFGRRKDNSEFPVEVSLSPYTTEKGRFVIAFIIDITIRVLQQKELETTLEKVKENAEELEASNAELENFAYISSHDLQEPLRKIQAFGDRLKTTEADRLSETGKDYLNRMMNASMRMQNLINDLLTFSRLGTREQSFVTVDLNVALKEVLSDLEIAIEKAGAKIESDALPEINGEPTQMRQLFQNLISNAIKFRKENEPCIIKISAKIIHTSFGKEMVELYFEDNGIGFDEKYNDKIFNIFQRLEGKKYEGSGIGLAICRKIANKHGGNIHAKSEPGNGSVFTVILERNRTPQQNNK